MVTAESNTMIRGHSEDSGKTLLGKVASPAGAEATSEEFTFWVPEGAPVEKTQIIHAVSSYGEHKVTYYAVVDEVFRRSRRRDVLEEADRFGGDAKVSLPLDSQGITYAKAKILNTEPPVLAPPREESTVFLSSEHEARIAYGVERMGQPLPIGLLKNGGDSYAGPAYIDLDYLLGANGAHLNVNGIAGVATKSSFLTCVLYRLLCHYDDYARSNPSALDKRAIVPIILNVKGYDLMWLDHSSSRYASKSEDSVWRAIGIDEPAPFAGAKFFVPEQATSRTPVPVGRSIEAYSWSLSDIIKLDLFPYLFSEDDREDENFLGLLQDIENFLTYEDHSSGESTRRLSDFAPQTFEELVKWVGTQANSKEDDRDLKGNHHTGTWRKFYRRLRRIVDEGEGLLVRYDKEGRPLKVTTSTTCPPKVIDIQSIRDQALQRFVVAAIFTQVSEARLGTNAVPNLSYVIVLDELNRWAPKGASDPITRLIEKVVAEMRSQGVILLGAQQQASQVSPRVIENCAIRALGRTGSLELSHTLWGFLSTGAKRRVENLQPNEKLVYQVNFREPMQMRVPFPRWAMRQGEAARGTPASRFVEREEWER